MPVKFEAVHVKSWLAHVESFAVHVKDKLGHVNCDLVHVKGRTFSSTATDGCISPWRNAKVLLKQAFVENGKKWTNLYREIALLMKRTNPFISIHSIYSPLFEFGSLD